MMDAFDHLDRGADRPAHGRPTFEVAIGLEIHAQLATNSKLFCACPVDPEAEPNSCCCPVCMGHPGVLPVVNREAVRLGLRAAVSLQAEALPISAWARKNYFYPDLPKGYQITQYEHPLARGGRLAFMSGGRERTCDLIRLHLEEDAGRLRHEPAGTLVDLNRCGTALLEIVTVPALASPREARDFATACRQLLQYCEVCEGRMELGHLRCDANVSLRRPGEHDLGVPTEIKNLNSFRFLEKALAAEISRQSEVLSEGRAIIPATLLWDEMAGCTRLMRSKETCPDYRYFSEPDLPALRVTSGDLAEARAAVPELPTDRARRLARLPGISTEVAARLTARRDTADYFEAVLAEDIAPAPLAAMILNELAAAEPRPDPEVKPRRASEAKSRPDPEVKPRPAPEAMRTLLRLRECGELSSRQGKRVLQVMLESGDDPRTIIEREGLRSERGEEALRAWAQAVLEDHPEEVAEYREGKSVLLRFFMGRLMERSGGRADPVRAREILLETLGTPGTAGTPGTPGTAGGSHAQPPAKEQNGPHGSVESEDRGARGPGRARGPEGKSSGGARGARKVHRPPEEP